MRVQPLSQCWHGGRSANAASGKRGPTGHAGMAGVRSEAPTECPMAKQGVESMKYAIITGVAAMALALNVGVASAQTQSSGAQKDAYNAGPSNGTSPGINTPGYNVGTSSANKSAGGTPVTAPARALTRRGTALPMALPTRARVGTPATGRVRVSTHRAIMLPTVPRRRLRVEAIARAVRRTRTRRLYNGYALSRRRGLIPVSFEGPGAPPGQRGEWRKIRALP